MPALDWITVKGFRSIKVIEKLSLGSLNLLIGPNGAGKSNIIEAFSFLQAIRSGTLQDYVARAGGAAKLLHFGADETQEIDLEVSFQDHTNQYEISLVPTSEDSLFPSSELAKFWNKAMYPKPFVQGLIRRGGEAGISVDKSEGIAKFVRQHLAGWRLYHFHDTSAMSGMRRTADIDDNRFLRPDGSNIASFLYLLREKHQISYDQIRASIRLVAPFFDDFELAPQALNPEKIRLGWKHRGSTAYFDASSMSDGTMRFVLLATLFLQPKLLRPSVVLVDEPELGLHPYAINVLASLMKQASFESQVFVSTQSTLLLDSFEPENVIVADRFEGGTTVSRLSSIDLAEWLDEYSLGQLWEKNVLGGRPSGG